jgi:hypothetical protein
MVGLKKLKKYRVIDEKLFEELRSHLSGFVFFRKDETGFYIKAPKLDIIDKLVESNNLVEV